MSSSSEQQVNYVEHHAYSIWLQKQQPPSLHRPHPPTRAVTTSMLLHLRSPVLGPGRWAMNTTSYFPGHVGTARIAKLFL